MKFKYSFFIFFFLLQFSTKAFPIQQTMESEFTIMKKTKSLGEKTYLHSLKFSKFLAKTSYYFLIAPYIFTFFSMVMGLKNGIFDKQPLGFGVFWISLIFNRLLSKWMALLSDAETAVKRRLQPKRAFDLCVRDNGQLFIEEHRDN